jgi:hypothetical protein
VLWFAVAAALATWNFTHWHSLDNHVLFTNTWTACMGFALLSDDPRGALAHNGRMAIGLCFLYACIWKLGTPAYVAGDFFEFSLLTDDRFRAASEWAGGLSNDMWEANQSALGGLYGTDTASVFAQLESTDRVATVGRLLTWCGLLLEAAIAAAFLLPLRGKARRIRSVALATFAATAYAIVPVSGFGALLMTMAAAQADDDRARRWWVGGLVAVVAWGVVWPKLGP